MSGYLTYPCIFHSCTSNSLHRPFYPHHHSRSISHHQARGLIIHSRHTTVHFLIINTRRTLACFESCVSQVFRSLLINSHSLILLQWVLRTVMGATSIPFLRLHNHQSVIRIIGKTILQVILAAAVFSAIAQLTNCRFWQTVVYNMSTAHSRTA